MNEAPLTILTRQTRFEPCTAQNIFLLSQALGGKPVNQLEPAALDGIAQKSKTPKHFILVHDESASYERKKT